MYFVETTLSYRSTLPSSRSYLSASEGSALRSDVHEELHVVLRVHANLRGCLSWMSELETILERLKLFRRVLNYSFCM